MDDQAHPLAGNTEVGKQKGIMDRGDAFDISRYLDSRPQDPAGNEIEVAFDSSIILPFLGLSASAPQMKSGVQAIQDPGKRNCLPDVLQPGDPRHDPLDAHSKAAVGPAGIPTQVEV